MRKSYSNQLRLDSLPIEQVTLNLESRDRIVPILLTPLFQDTH
jgi:transposase, IS5 family